MDDAKSCHERVENNHFSSYFHQQNSPLVFAQHEAGIELNFFEYLDSNRYLVELDIVKYGKNSMTSFLVPKP
jgi:hypothetical protein